MSINLADELVILLIFVISKHFVNAVTMGKVSQVDKMRMQMLREHGLRAKAITHVYPTHNGQFEHIMKAISNALL